MRVLPSVMFLAAGTLVASPAAAAATVQGEVNVYLGGDPAVCLGVRIVPRTPETEREIAEVFGTLQPAARRIAPELVKRAATDQGPKFGVELRCSNWAGYQFRNVAPGDYFVTLLARGGSGSARSDLGGAGLLSGFRQQAIYLMQPVRVNASGETVQLHFKHD